MSYLKKPKRPLKLSKILEKIDDYLLAELKEERGTRCELCGKSQQLGLFHVLPKGTHPRLRLSKSNLLIAGWFCCHLPWHHSYYEARDRLVPRIKELLGDDYEERLLALEMTLPKLDRVILEALLKSYEEKL